MTFESILIVIKSVNDDSSVRKKHFNVADIYIYILDTVYVTKTGICDWNPIDKC